MNPTRNTPDRQCKLDEMIDDVLNAMQAGESIDVDRFAKKYPELAADLNKMLPALLAMADWNPSAEGSLELTEPDPLQNKPIGDFQIIRQIGRGGMGVVYEARQLSIARDVALKVLPLAALIDDRALQRFRNEVNAIATLNHPNIVSVYSVGEERGVHYYAMQLIRGESLATIIRGLKTRALKPTPMTGETLGQVLSDMDEGFQSKELDVSKGNVEGNAKGQAYASGTTKKQIPAPAPIKFEAINTDAIETQALASSSTIETRPDLTFFRNAARLINKTAEALHHAHESGVIHRDIKPGNLLLDRSGTIFIADFGLARIETGQGVTMTGDTLGTLRYMSPEQVQADRTMLDHRTDIYSLGATLYELLTLQPMWPSQDRAVLVRQISSEEPVGAQTLNPAIPADLETIILKATRKSPDERYQTAEAMAEDISRFLDNKPIVAKRVTRIERFGKFTQRHPIAMLATMSGGLLLAATFALSTVFVSRAYHHESLARADEQVAREHAEKQSQLARDVVDDFYSSVAKEWLDGKGDLTELQSQMLTKARNLYEVFAEEESSDPNIQFDTAVANFDVAFIDKRMGNFEASIVFFMRAETLLAELINREPDNPKYIELLYHSQSERAWGYSAIGQFDQSIDLFRKAIGTRQQLIEVDLDSKNASYELAYDTYGIGLGHMYKNDVENAESEMRIALKLLTSALGDTSDDQGPGGLDLDTLSQILQLKSNCLTILSTVLADRGALVESASLYREALLLQEQVVELFPNDATFRYALAGCWFNRAESLAIMGDWPEALELYRLALDEMDEIVLEFPSFAVYSIIQSRTVHAVARALYETGKTGEAEQFYQRLFEIQEDLSVAFPEIAAIDSGAESWPLFVCLGHYEYGVLLYDTERSDEAMIELDIAIEADSEFPLPYYQRGDIYRNRGQEAKAIDDYRAAVKTSQEQMLDFQGTSSDRIEWGFFVAATLARLERWDESRKEFDQSEDLLSEFSAEFSFDQRFRNDAKQLLESQSK